MRNTARYVPASNCTGQVNEASEITLAGFYERRHEPFRASFGALSSVGPSKMKGAAIFLVLSRFDGHARAVQGLSRTT